MASSESNPDRPIGLSAGNPSSKGQRRRSLRAVFAADIAGFSGRMSLNETSTVNALSEIRAIGRRALDEHNGWLFGMPGDGLFATFESAVNAVQCALEIQQSLEARPHLSNTLLRIGIHLGEVIIEDDLPYGETLNIAARLESLADPGGILVSGPVMDAVSARIFATFEDRGTPVLKNIPRRIPTYAVMHPPARNAPDDAQVVRSRLDRTTRLDRDQLQRILDTQEESGVAGLLREGDELPPQEIANGPGRDSELPMPSLAEKLAQLPVLQLAPSQLPTPSRDAKEEVVVAEPQLEKTISEFSVPEAAAAAPLTTALVGELTKALAVHVGPLSRLIVEREMKAELSIFELISKLEEHIPNEKERLVFRVRASHVNASVNEPEDDP